MEWLVEFEGRQLPMEDVWSDEFARIVGPLRSTIEKALNDAADPNDLDGLEIIVYAEQEPDGPIWGVKFAGSPTAVNYAVSLVGDLAPITKPTH